MHSLSLSCHECISENVLVRLSQAANAFSVVIPVSGKRVEDFIKPGFVSGADHFLPTPTKMISHLVVFL